MDWRSGGDGWGREWRVASLLQGDATQVQEQRHTAMPNAGGTVGPLA